MNKAEIAEELGLTKAARQLDTVSHVHVNDVFVNQDGDSGIKFTVESREKYVLQKISRTLDEYDLSIENLDGDTEEKAVAISQKAVDVTPI